MAPAQIIAAARIKAAQGDHVRQLNCGAIEAYLCSVGFGAVYEANISNQKRTAITAPPGTDDYWLQVVGAQATTKKKPELMTEVIAAIEATGPSAVPSLIQEVIEMACSRAEAAG